MSVGSLLVKHGERSEFWNLLYTVVYFFVLVTLVAWQFCLDVWQFVLDSLSYLQTRILAYAPHKLYGICMGRKV